jgi:CBS domain-containing protein
VEGRAEGETIALVRVLEKRFGVLSTADRIAAARPPPWPSSVAAWVLADELRFGQQVRIQGSHQLIHLIRAAFDSAGFADLPFGHQGPRFLQKLLTVMGRPIVRSFDSLVPGSHRLDLCGTGAACGRVRPFCSTGEAGARGFRSAEPGVHWSHEGPAAPIPRSGEGELMLISQILRTKRPGVVVISPDASLRTAIALMVRQHVGSLVVVDEDQRLLGVVSEREIIQNLELEQPNMLATTVRSVMRTDVPVATQEDTIRSVMEVMTAARARHIPVIAYGCPIGIVSLGDIVKSRLDETIQENTVLKDIARVHWLSG